MSDEKRLIPILRRVQGELLLFEKQLSLFAKLAEEYYTYGGYYWALRDGLLVSPADNNGGAPSTLLELELKSIALGAQLTDKALVELEATSRSISKLLVECSTNAAVTSLGLHTECLGYVKEFKEHGLLLRDVARLVDFPLRFSATDLNLLVQKLRYRVHVPDLNPLINAFPC